MGPYDVALKHILRSGGRAFLGLLGVSEPVRRLETALSSVRERRVDFLGEVGRDRLIHIEFQSTKDDSMSLRMLGYYSEILETLADERKQSGAGPILDVRLRQVVIYVGAGRWTLAPVRHENLWFQFEMVNLAEIEAAPLVETGDIGDAVLGILCRGGTSPAMIRNILERIAAAPEDLRADALAQLLVLSGLRKADRRVQKEYTRMPIIVSVEDIPFLRAPIDEAFERGEAKGEAKMFGRLLLKKFGAAVPTGFVERLDALPTSVVEAMADRLEAASTIEDVLGSQMPRD